MTDVTLSSVMVTLLWFRMLCGIHLVHQKPIGFKVIIGICNKRQNKSYSELQPKTIPWNTRKVSLIYKVGCILAPLHKRYVVWMPPWRRLLLRARDSVEVVAFPMIGAYLWARIVDVKVVSFSFRPVAPSESVIFHMCCRKFADLKHLLLNRSNSMSWKTIHNIGHICS